MTTDLRASIEDMIADHRRAMARLVEGKPTVTDGHSDGKRVRYVRHETAETTLRAILDLIESADR